MARRRSGGSGAGWGILVVLGGVVWLVSTIYQFIVENSAGIIFGLAVLGIVAVFVFAITRFGRNRALNSASETSELRSAANVGRPTVGTLDLTGLAVARSFTFGQPMNARWIDVGQAVQVQDTVISAGLFYLGEAVRLPDGRAVNQYVINPKLPISSDQADVVGSSMSYWPSYASVTPNARRAFLKWMAGGRSDQGYNIGYVFIFFYGLEHRQFVDKDPAVARVLIPEVERLLSIYGQNHSFRHYATNFLTYARLAAGLPLEPPRLSPERSGLPDLPPEVRLYLGGKLANSNVLSAEDALIWILALPDTYLRTPAVRCFEEFVALWKLRFAEKFPSGFQINVPTKKIKFTYRAASNAFQADVSGPYGQYPDIAAVRQSLGKLQSLAHACTEELSSFSRFVGRRPGEKSSIHAALLLPEALRRATLASAIRDVDRRVTAIMGSQRTATTKMREILKAAAFEFPETGKLPQSIFDQLGSVLDRIDVAIEPDRRYGGGVAQLDDQVVVFKADKGGPINAKNPTYQAMKVQVEVSALAAVAGGAATNDELQTIIANVKQRQDLSRVEGLRLIAYAITIFKSPPKQARILGRLAERPESEREAIAKAAISVVSTEDKVDPNAVRFLERVYKTLGLPHDKVYAELHRAAGNPDEPVPVSAEKRVPGIPIPKPQREGIQIDAGRLAAVQRQTQEVSKILTQIFADDADSLNIAPEVSPSVDGSPFGGLDIGHAELVEYMEIKGEIPRQEFDERAKSLKLLPEGAIETINDWAIDQFNEPLLEGDEHIVLSANLRDRLAELRKTLS